MPIILGMMSLGQLGKSISDARREQGLRQVDLATRAALSRATVSYTHLIARIGGRLRPSAIAFFLQCVDMRNPSSGSAGLSFVRSQTRAVVTFSVTPSILLVAVSYTHLDVYKRQAL